MAVGTKVERARRAAGLSQVAAGEITRMSNVTFGRKEKSPESFTVGEFFDLYHEMDADSREIMWSWLVELRDKKF